MKNEAGRQYAGASAPERRADRRSRLIEAGLDLVLESGVASLTVIGVCTRAGLTKRYFYESFDGLDTLLATTLTEVLSGVAHTIDTADPEATSAPEEINRLAVEAILTAFDDPRVARLYLESAGYPHLLEARSTAVSAFVDQLLKLFTGRDESTARETMIAHLLISGTTHVVALWLGGDLDMTREQFVAILVELGTEAARLINTTQGS